MLLAGVLVEASAVAVWSEIALALSKKMFAWVSPTNRATDKEMNLYILFKFNISSIRLI